MAVSSVEAEKSDALSRLRIQRAAPPKSSGFGRFVKVILVLILLLAIAAGGVVVAMRYGVISANTGWLTMPEAIQPRQEVRLAVVNVVTGRSGDATVVATGYLESRYQAQIGARAPGRIEKIDAEEGTVVETNQVLAVLEHADLDASLAAMEANVARAKAAVQEQEIVILQRKREFERAEKVFNSKSLAESEYDIAKYAYDGAIARRDSMKADLDLADARVREAKQMRANMFILAPFNGTVISKNAEVGESILPGGMGEASGRGSVVTVADLKHLEVDADVKEDFIGRITEGQSAEVVVDAIPNYRYQARVRKIIPMGDRARSTIKVKVEITNVDGRLFPEMSATVYFLPDESKSPEDPAKPRVFCDAKAILGPDGNQYVWIADEDDRVRRHDVKVAASRDGRTEITDGLSGGERVIIPPPDIQPGQLVKIAE